MDGWSLSGLLQRLHKIILQSTKHMIHNSCSYYYHISTTKYFFEPVAYLCDRSIGHRCCQSVYLIWAARSGLKKWLANIDMNWNDPEGFLKIQNADLQLQKFWGGVLRIYIWTSSQEMLMADPETTFRKWVGWTIAFISQQKESITDAQICQHLTLWLTPAWLRPRPLSDQLNHKVCGRTQASIFLKTP